MNFSLLAACWCCIHCMHVKNHAESWWYRLQPCIDHVTYTWFVLFQLSYIEIDEITPAERPVLFVNLIVATFLIHCSLSDSLFNTKFSLLCIVQVIFECIHNVLMSFTTCLLPWTFAFLFYEVGFGFSTSKAFIW